MLYIKIWWYFTEYSVAVLNKITYVYKLFGQPSYIWYPLYIDFSIDDTENQLLMQDTETVRCLPQ